MRQLMRKIRPLTTALVLVNTLLLLGITHRAWQGTQSVALIATPPKPFRAPQVRTDVPNHAHIDLAPLQQHALFHASRSFFVAPPPSMVPISPPRPDYRFVGVFVIPGKPALAMVVQSATGAARKLKVGDDLEGWSVQSVESQRVVLQYEQETMEITRSAGGSGIGLQTTPLARGNPSSVGGGTRILGSNPSASQVSSAPSQPLSGSPRLYRPPTGQ